MEKLAQALMAFVAFSASLLSVSMPTDGKVIEYLNYDANGDVRHEFASTFYKSNKEVRNILDPVIKIKVQVSDTIGYTDVASGTGFSVLYDKKLNKSYVLTNAHICEIKDIIPVESRFVYENRYIITSPDSNISLGELKILGKDDNKDLCLMETDGYIAPAKIAKSSYKVKQLEKIKIVGAPNGVYPIILDSYISNLFSKSALSEEFKNDRPLYLISSIIDSGQSGSPIFNKDEEVIGVIFINLSNSDGPIYGGIAIPLGDIIEFLSLYRML